jgi:hypothetical protein
MPASNIPTVLLNGNGSVTIEGQFTDIDDYTVTLLHVWLAGTGDDGQDGVGLAIDCLEEGQPNVEVQGKEFTIAGAKGAAPKGMPDADFGEGPATVSGIAVLTPRPPNPKHLVAEVIQWGRTLTLKTHVAR